MFHNNVLINTNNIFLKFLIFATLLAISAKEKNDEIFTYFSQKTWFEMPCKLETICMKCQIIAMQIVSIGDNLHEMSNHVFWEK